MCQWKKKGQDKKVHQLNQLLLKRPQLALLVSLLKSVPTSAHPCATRIINTILLFFGSAPAPAPAVKEEAGMADAEEDEDDMLAKVKYCVASY